MSTIVEMTPDQTARKTRLSVLAKADPDALRAYWAAYLNGANDPAHQILRPAEIGTVMVRGRTGAVGAPFNLGEMTVTRCSLRLGDTGSVGHGTVQGRDKDAARIVALIDALCEAGQATRLSETVIAPLQAVQAATRRARQEKADATKVEFFTMVRGEN